MDICFVTNGVQEFVEGQVAAHPNAYPAARKAMSEGGAAVIDEQGEALGVGAPYYRYTVGQRKGLGVASNRRLYVLDVDAAENKVKVGGAAELASTGLIGERLHWIGAAPEPEQSGERTSGEPAAIRATVQIRSQHEGVMADIVPLADGTVRVAFDTPQSAVTPGQAAVFYLGSRVLGGCWVESSIQSA